MSKFVFLSRSKVQLRNLLIEGVVRYPIILCTGTSHSLLCGINLF
ncbi:unnamed protein product [Larinioides sclopetarius]|uniref:Uncharacterized protein n=1 Tax=Larinioides sclopetarius TaxID=280406 RepID=A0AAV1YST5_9ARAC